MFINIALSVDLDTYYLQFYWLIWRELWILFYELVFV